MEIYKQVCDPSDREELAGLTPHDIISLATGDTINDILVPLRKLIKLLPITPIDAEELRRIYEHARQVLLAA
jgi:DNA-directed RNA polymerase subunit F